MGDMKDNTPVEIDYYRNRGFMQTGLRRISKGGVELHEPRSLVCHPSECLGMTIVFGMERFHAHRSVHRVRHPFA